MAQQHPITPPQWQMDAWQARIETMGAHLPSILLEVAQWGADQELEACCSLLQQQGFDLVDYLRAARRPKPPSLKEQALKALDEALFMADDVPPEGICSDQVDIIRRALEQLDG